MNRMFLNVSLALAILPLLNGCMKMGPDFRRPDTGIQVPGSYQYAPTKQETPWPEDEWWRVFHNTEINRLVEEVLRNNLDIKNAAARILEMQSKLVQTRADRFPGLNLEGQVKRQQKGVDAAVVTYEDQTFQIESQRQTRTYSYHYLSLAASFELDLWGRLARAEEAALANLLQAEENRQTVAQTVVAETIILYLQMEAIERQLQITKESIKNFRRNLDLVENRYERGLTSILDVRQARRILARAEVLLPSQRQDLGTTQQKLAVLLGRYPRTRPPRPQQEDYFKLLAPVPPGLPSELLLRRPDIRKAEAELRALNAKVGVAKASRFPSITLTGSSGYASYELNQLFRPDSFLWSIAAGLGQPLFDAGKLKANQRAAEARYRQGVTKYAKKVLTAFSEVEKALLTRKEQLERRDRTLKFLIEARETRKVAETRYMRGLVDYLTVLDAQQTQFQAEENLVLVDLAIMSNRVTLHRALGGGWAE